MRLLPPSQCLLSQQLLSREILGEHAQKKTLFFLTDSQLLSYTAQGLAYPCPHTHLYQTPQTYPQSHEMS